MPILRVGGVWRKMAAPWARAHWAHSFGPGPTPIWAFSRGFIWALGPGPFGPIHLGPGPLGPFGSIGLIFYEKSLDSIIS